MDFDDLAQDCGNSIANALELPQPCTRPSIYVSGVTSCLLFLVLPSSVLFCSSICSNYSWLSQAIGSCCNPLLPSIVITITIIIIVTIIGHDTYQPTIITNKNISIL